MNTSRTPPVAACPHCGKESPWDTNNRFRPFCCERCKMIDLGKWADEEFRVALPQEEQEFTSPPHQA
ncbi:MAG: DNA gyrase inhibitor YacG [Gallionella sp.]|nr:DNA gyrase inhibitor YacG [Gallionella sp.]